MKKTFISRFTASILTVCMLLIGTPIPLSAITNNIPTVETTETVQNAENRAKNSSAPANDSISTIPATTSKELIAPRYVDSSQFYNAKHMVRMENQELLNTYVFANYDGTQTVYYMGEDVKFKDKNGEIREKDITLVKNATGFGIVESNIDLQIPTNPESGIDVSYSNHTVTLIPQGTVNTVKGAQNKNTVLYANMFGPETALVYTPTLSGIKEDIILTKYQPNASFDFILQTDGLYLYNSTSGYYLATSKDSLPLFYLGEILVYDAIGKPDIGTMDVTVLEDGNRYLLTVSANESFLSDSTTAYPVVIDPTITVSKSNDGTDYIEDSPIYSARPDKNHGTYTYNRMGTPSSSYGVGRTVVRLNSLISSEAYTQSTASQIYEVKFYTKESSGGSSQFINLYPLSNKYWTESDVTWNNIGTYYTSLNCGNTMNGESVTAFDITSLAKKWKEGTRYADAGFIMISSDETVDKGFYSSEYSVLDNCPYVTMRYEQVHVGGSSFEYSLSIPLDTCYATSVSAFGAKRYYRFIPASTGFYTIQSSSIVSGDPYITLYSPFEESLGTHDNISSTNKNFRITYHLISGATYYFTLQSVDASMGVYDFNITKTQNYSQVNYVTIYPGVKRTSISYEYNVRFYRIRASSSSEYIFFSSNTLKGNPEIWIYDSDLTQIGYDNDSVDGKNFCLSIQLTAGKDYIIAARHNGAETGTFDLNSFAEMGLSNGKYHIGNIGSWLYMDIHLPDYENYIDQWSFHTDLQEKWNIQKQSDGYYVIQSEYGEKKYVGISDAQIGVNNIRLYENIDGTTKWKIYTSSVGVILMPKNAKGKVLYAPDMNLDTELQLGSLYTLAGENHLWKISPVRTFEATVNNYFDSGFSVYFQENASSSIQRINQYMSSVATVYYNLFELTINHNNAISYQSEIDTCKGTVTLQNLETLCAHSDTVHTDRSNLISSFGNDVSGNSTTTNVLWSLHKITSTSTSGQTNYNRSCSSGTSVFLLSKYTSNDNSVLSTLYQGVLLHELNHQYGARDHYHEPSIAGDPTSCKFPDICSTCGSEPRDPSCIMNNSSQNISNSEEIICRQCKEDILTHLRLHHYN